MPKSTLAVTLLGTVLAAVAIVLTALELDEDGHASALLRRLARLACAVVVLACCASFATTPATTAQFATASIHQEHTHV